MSNKCGVVKMVFMGYQVVPCRVYCGRLAYIVVYSEFTKNRTKLTP